MNKVTDITELLKEPKKVDPDDFYTKYYSNLKEGKHNLKIKTSKLLDTEIKIKGKNWKVERIEYTVCKNILPDGSLCGYPITTTDTHKGESYCEACGLVNDSIKYVVPSNYTVGEYTEDIKKELSESGEHITKLLKSSMFNRIIENTPKITKEGKVEYGNKKEWRELQKKYTLDNLSSALHMKQFQKEEVQDIIDTYPMNKIHSRIGFKTIIAGVCMYVLRLFNPKRGDLKYSNKIFSSYGLTKRNYDVIKKNLDRLLSDRDM